MTSAEVRKLRTQLQRDLVDNDDQVRAQTAELVHEWLLDRARELAGATHVWNRDELVALIRTHAETALLERLIEKPGSFTVKELREVLASMNPSTEVVQGRVDPMALIGSLDISGSEKGKLIAALADVAKQNIRANLGKGQPDGRTTSAQ